MAVVRHRNPDRHLHDGQERTNPALGMELHWYPNDRRRGPGRHHARRMGCPTSPGDDGPNALVSGLMRKLHHALRYAMGGDDLLGGRR